MARKLAAGNWKMNGTGDALGMLRTLAEETPNPSCDILVCPPATLIHRATQAVENTRIHIGAQDCHAETNGAHTGDLSAQMLVDAGASHVILGHSERRQDHGETNADVHAKMQAALAQNLTVILCIGESLAQREAGDTLDHLATQLHGSLPKDADVRRVVIAYEPIWAIGTGKIPTLEQIAEVHQFIRSTLGAAASDMPLLYGGSVKASNAAEIFAVPDVDGALVGGASLSAADFSPIVKALDASS